MDIDTPRNESASPLHNKTTIIHCLFFIFSTVKSIEDCNIQMETSYSSPFDLWHILHASASTRECTELMNDIMDVEEIRDPSVFIPPCSMHWKEQKHVYSYLIFRIIQDCKDTWTSEQCLLLQRQFQAPLERKQELNTHEFTCWLDMHHISRLKQLFEVVRGFKTITL